MRRAILVLIFSLGCSSEVDTGVLGQGSTTSSGTDTPCVPGQTIACACLGGSAGVQSCEADGTGYGACTCEITSGETTGVGGMGTSSSSTGGMGGMISCVTQSDCAPLNAPCHLGSCVDGACSTTELPDGTTCDDGNPCTTDGTCQSATCVGGPMISCAQLDTACSQGVCDPQSGCISKAANEGNPCDDGLFCTDPDVCTAGSCTGKPKVCPAPPDVCQSAACDEATNTCGGTPGNNGTFCDDGNVCTMGEKCGGGACGGGQAVNGISCNDGNACTTNDTCAVGACKGTAIVACVDGDGCCPAACSAQNDSDCGITMWSQGTMQWPDDACNPTNSFGSCNTNDQTDADAWATFVCQQNGYSKGVWTGLKMAGCSGNLPNGAPSVSVYCLGGSIPCMPSFESTCQPSDQTVVQFTCSK